MTLMNTVATALIGAMLLAMTAPAGAERSPIPARPNIVDIAGDANGIGFADVATPVQIPEADILEAWFTNDRTTITAHWHISAAPEVGDSIQLVMRGNPDPSASNPEVPEVPRVTSRPRCLFFSVIYRTVDTEPDEPYTAFTDGCLYGEDVPTEYFIGKPKVTRLDDGTAIISGTFPRSETPALKGKTVITGVNALTWNADWIAGGRPTLKTLDSAPPGRDYKVR